MDNSFELIDTIIKSRLLAYDDEGYVDLLEKDVDSFRKRDRDASDEELEPIVENFSDALTACDAFGPKYMINAYIRASDVYCSLDFDWGSKKQMATRRKFCRWMFRQAYLKNPHLYDDGYSPKREDVELLRLFKPDPESDREEIDIAFTMLLTFDVIKPFGSESVRALKYRSPADRRENMIELLEILKEDIPTFGVMQSLHSLEKALDELNDPDFATSAFPPAAMWGILNNIALDMKANSSPAELLDSHVEQNGYSMPGIWVDDAQENRKRFWVFPENKLMAFCYSFNTSEWVLTPYEFAFSKLEHEFSFDEVCVLATLRGNLQVFMKGKMDEDELARLKYKLDDRDEEGCFQTIRFSLESGSEYPYWLSWRKFMRLPADDPRMQEYMGVIDQIYNQSEMLRSFSYRNIGACITDTPDCLMGLDGANLYLSDVQVTKNGFLERINAVGEYPLYNYYTGFSTEGKSLSLFGIEISDEQPMYIVPRDPLFFEELDKRLNAKSLVADFPNRAERQEFLRRYEDFKETVMNTEFAHQVTIYKNLPNGSPPVLCFNQISRTFRIDEIVEWFGVKKITSREQLSNL